MNNYSEQTATPVDLLVDIELTAIANNGAPTAEVTLNGELLLRGPVHDHVRLKSTLPVSSVLDLQVTLVDKQYHGYLETALLIKYVRVNGIEIVPEYTHEFTYSTDQGAKSPTYYMGRVGTMRLDTVVPFYHWLHEVSGQGWLLYPAAVEYNTDQ